MKPKAIVNATLRTRCIGFACVWGILVGGMSGVYAQYEQYVWQTHRSTAVNAPPEFTEELERHRPDTGGGSFAPGVFLLR